MWKFKRKKNTKNTGDGPLTKSQTQPLILNPYLIPNTPRIPPLDPPTDPLHDRLRMDQDSQYTCEDNFVPNLQHLIYTTVNISDETGYTVLENAYLYIIIINLPPKMI